MDFNFAGYFTIWSKSIADVQQIFWCQYIEPIKNGIMHLEPPMFVRHVHFSAMSYN